jgi:TATA-binding protein-associated factor
MPGYLGTEKQFNEMYSKPILAARDAKATSKQQEIGIHLIHYFLLSHFTFRTFSKSVVVVVVVVVFIIVVYVECNTNFKATVTLETLHRQVLPFILRRVKSDVLRDLPPKIIQDYCCDLSPLQVSSYSSRTSSCRN